MPGTSQDQTYVRLIGARLLQAAAIRDMCCVTGILVVAALLSAPVHADTSTAFLKPQKASHAPAGFDGLCARYAWVCTPSVTSTMTEAEQLRLAYKVNRSVNRQVREIADRDQYGTEEYWALPTARGGDCEDLVLLKKKMLIERGVPSQSLLIATVLDRALNSHAVLVFRSATEDLVLDNLTNRILPWRKTGYTFLRLQDPKAMSRWNVVLAGGLIGDRPTASR